MQWGAFLLSIVGLYATFKFYSLYRSQNSLKYLGLVLAGSFFILTQASIVIEGLVAGYGLTIYADLIVEWGHVLCLAFILSSLAVFIRDSKPVFAQFPLLYSALPLLIVVSYVLVKDTYAIKEWLISIYQGGAILVALLMYGVYTYRQREYMTVLGGIGLFLVTFLLYWYVPEIQDPYHWVWKMLLGGGILVTVYGLEQVRLKMSAETVQTI